MGSGSSLALVWLRNSLRVADNEALLAASRSSATNLLIYYALDPSRLRPRAAAGAGLELVQQLPSLGPHQCACVALLLLLWKATGAPCNFLAVVLLLARLVSCFWSGT